MDAHSLQDTAHAFFHSDLWERYPADALFTVQCAQEETLYCLVMGDPPDVPVTLMVYPGDAGLSSYFRLRTLPPEAPRYQVREAMVQQNCLICTFAPGSHAATFGRRFPFQVPTTLADPQDLARMQAVLEAANFLAAQETPYFADQMTVITPTGEGFTLSAAPFPEGSLLRVPSPALTDEMAGLLRDLETNPEQELFAELTISPNPDPKEPAYYPVGLLLVDPQEGIVAMPMVTNFLQDGFELVGGLLSFAIEHGKPWQLRVRDDTTYLFLLQTCEQIGIPLEIDRDLPQLAAVKEQYESSLEA